MKTAKVKSKIARGILDTSCVNITGINFKSKDGCLCKYDVAKMLAINDSTIVPAVALVLSGAVATESSMVAFLKGTRGIFYLKSGGTIKTFQRVQQDAFGTVIADDGTGVGALIGVAGEDAKPGDLFKVAIDTSIKQRKKARKSKSTKAPANHNEVKVTAAWIFAVKAIAIAEDETAKAITAWSYADYIQDDDPHKKINRTAAAHSARGASIAWANAAKALADWAKFTRSEIANVK